MRAIASTIMALLVFTCLVGAASALVNMSLEEAGGRTNLERNTVYQLNCTLTPDQATSISQVYAYIHYPKAIFTEVILTDLLGEVCPIVWETTYVNSAFEDDGNWVTAQYLMANTEGEDWSAGAESTLIYALTFRVRPDAPLISTNVNFTQSATISDDGGGNVTGTVENYSFTVILDSTPPVTLANPAGGYYATDPSITLAINEPGTIFHKVDAISEYTPYVVAIPLSGAVGTVTTHELYFYGEDDPVGKSPNQEVPNLEVYHIDKEEPAVSGITADPEMIGMGGAVDISFTVTDLSEVLGNGGRPESVFLGGRMTEWVSGTDAGSFTYRLVVNGTESDGDVVVRVADAAGNFTVQTASDVVAYDLDGPIFTIEASPDPIYLQELMELTITADEALSGEKPVVEVGGEDGHYDQHQQLIYSYSYLLTSRGWEANFGWLNLDGDRDKDGLPDWWETKFELDPDKAYGPDGAAGDPDEDGWSNLQEYQFYLQAGKFADPFDPASGGQAIPLHRGWNLISYTLNTVWYKGSTAPSSLLEGVSKVRIEGDKWSDFFSSARFKGSASNMIAAQAKHPNGDWKYYGQFLPDWRSSLDYISPDEGLWINMAQDDVLILEGKSEESSRRVEPDGNGIYPSITLNPGWNLVGILPQTRFYQIGWESDISTPSDLVNSQGYDSLEETLQAAFNLSETEFEKIAAIQIMYSNGVKAYDSSVPMRYQSLRYVQPGSGAWIRLKDGESTAVMELNYMEPQ